MDLVYDLIFICLLKRDQNLSIQKLHLSDIHRFNMLTVNRWAICQWNEKFPSAVAPRANLDPGLIFFLFIFFIGRSLTDSRSTSRMLNRWMSLKCNFWILRFWSCFSISWRLHKFLTIFSQSKWILLRCIKMRHSETNGCSQSESSWTHLRIKWWICLTWTLK